MAKYYVTYQTLLLVHDADSRAKAAVLVLRQKEEQLRKNTTVYVDERGHRKRDARSKFRVDTGRVDGRRVWTLTLKKTSGW